MTSTVAVTAGAGVHTGQIPAYDAVHALTVSGLTAYNGAVVSGRLTTPDLAELLAPAATGTVAAGSVTLALNCDTDEMATLVGAGPTSPLCGLLSLSVVSTGEQIAVAPVNIAPAVRPGTGTSTPTESPGASLAEQTAAIAAHNALAAAHPFSAVDRYRYGGTAGAVTEGAITALARTMLARATATLMRGDLGAAPLAAVKHIWLPAGAAIPRATNGAASGTVEAATNDVMYDVFDFDSATAEGIAWVITLPEWDLGAIKFKPVWTAATGSGTFSLAVSGRAYPDDDAIDQAAGTAQTSTDTLITAGDIHIGPASAAITVAGTLAANLPIILQGVRDISDTLNADARLLGIIVEYTEAATEEAAW